VVTGSTSGIGAPIARRLAAEGASVIVSGRNEAAAQRVVEQIPAPGVGAAEFVRLDLPHPEACTQLIDVAVERFGGIDALVNNAGVFPRVVMEEATVDDWWQVLSVNLVSAGLLAAAAVPHMRARGGGSIVNIGSGNAYGGGANLTPYSCRTGGLLTLTKNLAAQCAKDNIRVNWITVGWMLTEGEAVVQAGEGRSREDVEQMIRRATRLPRLATGDDIAAAVAFLLSDDAEMITSCELNVSGGVVIR